MPNKGANAGDFDPCRIWITSFRRKVLHKVLKKHFDEKVLPALEGSMFDPTSNARPLAKAFSLTFEAKEDAKAAIAVIREAGGSLTWDDPRDPSSATVLKVKPDQTLVQRQKNRILGFLWTPLEKLFKTSDRFNREGWRFRSLPSDSVLYITNEVDHATVVSVEQDGREFEAGDVVTLEAVEQFGFNVQQAQHAIADGIKEYNTRKR